MIYLKANVKELYNVRYLNDDSECVKKCCSLINNRAQKQMKAGEI